MDKGSLKVILNNELNKKINLSLVKLRKKKIKLKYLAYKIGIDYSVLWRHLNNPNFIPLIVLKNLENITNMPLKNSIIYCYLPLSKNKIKIPKKLDKNLSRLIGCIIADGHLKTRKSGRGFHYELIIREEYKSNIKAAAQWLNETFGININIRKKDNYHFIYISNKIIHNFFTKIIGLPEGKKAEIVSTPNIISSSKILIKRCYIQGLFMFDGGVDYRTGYVNYISKSKKLIEEIINLLKEINLQPDYISLEEDRYKRYKIRFRKKEKLKKCIVLFERKTEKWWRLQEHLYGLKGITKDLKILTKSLDKYYPKVRDSAITFSDVIKSICLLEEKSNLLTISQKLNRNKTVVYEFLRKLEYWGIIKSYKIGLKKYYKLNNIFKIPRR